MTNTPSGQIYDVEAISMKRVIRTNRDEKHLSGCSFDFDLGDNYDATFLESAMYDLFADNGLDVKGVDFRSVDYPRGRTYSQCGIDFEWKGDTYDANLIEEDIADIIEDEGGNFFGIDFYSLDAPMVE